MKNAYLIGQITIKDRNKWAEYRSQVTATLEPWDGNLVFRGKLSSVLSGSNQHSDTVVIRFPSLKQLEDWHASPQYQSIIPLRQQAADMNLLAYEEE